MKAVVILLALATLAAAMVPRQRRAIDVAEVNSGDPKFCAPTTPCSWTIYNPSNKMITTNIANNYCICRAGTECMLSEDDVTANAFVFHCKESKS